MKRDFIIDSNFVVLVSIVNQVIENAPEHLINNKDCRLTAYYNEDDNIELDLFIPSTIQNIH